MAGGTAVDLEAAGPGVEVQKLSTEPRLLDASARHRSLASTPAAYSPDVVAPTRRRRSTRNDSSRPTGGADQLPRRRVVWGDSPYRIPRGGAHGARCSRSKSSPPPPPQHRHASRRRACTARMRGVPRPLARRAPLSTGVRVQRRGNRRRALSRVRRPAAIRGGGQPRLPARVPAGGLDVVHAAHAVGRRTELSPRIPRPDGAVRSGRLPAGVSRGRSLAPAHAGAADPSFTRPSTWR